jgi:hypothetical protein
MEPICTSVRMVFGSNYVFIFNYVEFIAFAKMPNLGIRRVQLTGKQTSSK